MVVKAGLHPKKVMHCIWWDWKDIVHYELLPPNKTIDSTKYYSQLTKLKQAVHQKQLELANRKGVVFHQDNARPHVPLMSRSLNVLKNHLDDFFAQRSQDFYERRIMKLVERWQKVIEQNGTYLVD
ncbi:histone-lysine N-methyltransferase SETMAR-like [Harpegnathos saltator]|uniref:histone-lysine N-methyltransferase SETMAR-like n=1 Tax=Harpegnathos saltator TaxID=610380 RepID=UPI000DBEE9F2|nr:histone-lysine N-methyltransferase SETMAR-like [Harpegnathos saltator]